MLLSKKVILGTISLIFSLQITVFAKTTLLHRAAAAGDVNKITHLIKKGATLSSRDKNGNTPLHIALINNEADATIEIINALKESLINKQNDSATRFFQFFKKKNAQTLPLGANNADQTELIIAIKNNQNDIAKSIIELAKSDKTFDSDLYLNGDGYGLRSPTYYAIQAKNIAALDLLYSQGAKINPDALFWINWHNAEASDIANILLDHGQNPNNNDNLDGHTALHRAVMAENTAAIKILLNAGAKTDIKDRQGKTAHNYAFTRKIKNLLLHGTEEEEPLSFDSNIDEED